MNKAARGCVTPPPVLIAVRNPLNCLLTVLADVCRRLHNLQHCLVRLTQMTRKLVIIPTVNQTYSIPQTPPQGIHAVRTTWEL